MRFCERTACSRCTTCWRSAAVRAPPTRASREPDAAGAPSRVSHGESMVEESIAFGVGGVLDCAGALNLGQELMKFLLPGRYVCIEPNNWQALDLPCNLCGVAYAGPGSVVAQLVCDRQIKALNHTKGVQELVRSLVPPGPTGGPRAVAGPQPPPRFAAGQVGCGLPEQYRL